MAEALRWIKAPTCSTPNLLLTMNTSVPAPGRQARDLLHPRLQLGRGQPRLLHPRGPHGARGQVSVVLPLPCAVALPGSSCGSMQAAGCRACTEPSISSTFLAHALPLPPGLKPTLQVRLLRGPPVSCFTAVFWWCAQRLCCSAQGGGSRARLRAAGSGATAAALPQEGSAAGHDAQRAHQPGTPPNFSCLPSPRRPASNLDPYVVTRLLCETALLM